MGDLVFALVSIVSLGAAATALGLAFRHHAALLVHEVLPPAQNDKAE